MTNRELFENITTDTKILFYHDKLAMIDWTVSICTKKRKVTNVKGKLGTREPRQVVALRKYLKEQYNII